MAKKRTRSKKAAAPQVPAPPAPPTPTDASPLIAKQPEPTTAFVPPPESLAVPVYEIDIEKHFASPSLAAAQDQVIAEAGRRAAERVALPAAPRRASSPLLAGALSVWLVVAALLLIRPAIVQGPVDHPWSPKPENAEASLRYGLWLADGRVQEFLRSRGRMPSFLAEAGVADTSLALVVELRTQYRLEGRDGPLELELASSMAADSFLGASRDQLRGK